MTTAIKNLSNTQVRFIVDQLVKELSLGDAVVDLSADDLSVPLSAIDYRQIKVYLSELWEMSLIYQEKIIHWIQMSLEESEHRQVIAMDRTTGFVSIVGMILFYRLAKQKLDQQSHSQFQANQISSSLLKSPTVQQKRSIALANHQLLLSDIHTTLAPADSIQHATDIVIFTVVKAEYDAVLDHLSNKKTVSAKGLVYTKGTIGTLTVILRRVSEQGDVDMGIEAATAFDYFQPRIALLVGIAGQLKKVAIGDVVIADASYNYESGKETKTQFRARPKGGNFSFELRELARHLADNADWLPLIQQESWNFKITNGTIVSGNRVLITADSRPFQDIKQHYEDALAVAMEGFGFVRALQRYAHVKGLEIRGISDIIALENKDENYDDGSREQAARHATKFALELLQQIEKGSKR